MIVYSLGLKAVQIFESFIVSIKHSHLIQIQELLTDTVSLIFKIIVILKYFRVLITLDQQIDQYQRSVFSFFDMFGFLGGIFGVFKLWGSLLVQFTSTRAFYSSIISKLYHVNVQREENIKPQLNNYNNLKPTLHNKDPAKVHPKMIQNCINKIDNYEGQFAKAKLEEESKLDSSLSLRSITKRQDLKSNFSLLRS